MNSCFYLCLALLSSSLFTVNPAIASEYECSAYNELRHISLGYPGKNHLCEVSVTKLGEQPDVKWYANHDSKFCSRKLDELVGKYQDIWKFDCQRWPDRVGLGALSDRHRGLVDSVVKNSIQTGLGATPAYKVTGARVNSAQLTSKNSMAITVQLFLRYDTADVSENPFSSKIFYIVDDGVQFSTSVLPELEPSIAPLDDGYTIDSAIISAILPSGQFEVSTTVFSPIGGEQPRCFGTQYFYPGPEGILESVKQHKYICKA